jgi:hypothetical protein
MVNGSRPIGIAGTQLHQLKFGSKFESVFIVDHVWHNHLRHRKLPVPESSVLSTRMDICHQQAPEGEPEWPDRLHFTCDDKALGMRRSPGHLKGFVVERYSVCVRPQIEIGAE